MNYYYLNSVERERPPTEGALTEERHQHTATHAQSSWREGRLSHLGLTFVHTRSLLNAYSEYAVRGVGPKVPRKVGESDPVPLVLSATAVRPCE